MNSKHGDPPSCPAGKLGFRPEQPADAPLLFALYSSTREEELAMTGWDSATREAFLQMQFAAMMKGYRSMFPNGEFSIILLNETPVGRMVVDRSGPELHLADIVISPGSRNQGIGSAVMGGLMEEARQSGKPMRLYVFKTSRAIGFYQRLGFVKIDETSINEHMEWRGDMSAA